MVCPKCKSENVTIQVVNQAKLVNKHHSIWWWLFLGWWWIPIKWCFFTGIALLVKIFSKKKKIKNTMVKTAICQSCGNSWKV